MCQMIYYKFMYKHNLSCKKGCKTRMVLKFNESLLRENDVAASFSVFFTTVCPVFSFPVENQDG